MKLLRSPFQSRTPAGSYVQTLVARIGAADLKSAISKSEEVSVLQQHSGERERLTMFHIMFEDADIIPMLEGIIERLKHSEKCLEDVRVIVDDNERDATKRINEIRQAMRK